MVLLLLAYACTAPPLGPPAPEPTSAQGSDTASDSDPDPEPEPEPVAMQLSWSCPDPAAEMSYHNVASKWGLVESQDDGDFPTWGGAVGLIDVDGDWDDDVLIAPRNQGLWLQRNVGDGLQAEHLLDVLDVVAFAAGDVDGDRDLDLWVGTSGSDMYLLRNDGQGGFTDDTKASGLADIIATNEKKGADFGDFDGDGDLDLIIAQGGAVETRDEFLLVMLRNDGTGSFEDVSFWLDTSVRDAFTWLSLWADLDQDGDQDLFLANDLHHEKGPSRLLRNDGLDGAGWAFADVTEDCYCGEGVYAMGASTGDYNGDGRIDLFLTATGPNQLLRNEGDLTFLDTTASVNATVYEDHFNTDNLAQMSLGSSFLDHDNDGWLDLMVVGGRLAVDEASLGLQEPEQPNRMLRWSPDEEQFEDVTSAIGVTGVEDGRGVAFGLLDHDGYPDLLIGNIGAPSLLYRSQCAAPTSLVVELISHSANTFGVGARVSLTTSERTIVRAVRSATGVYAVNHPRAWFGLGDMTPVSLEIDWPSGVSQTVDLSPDAAGLLFVEEPL